MYESKAGLALARPWSTSKRAYRVIPAKSGKQYHQLQRSRSRCISRGVRFTIRIQAFRNLSKQPYFDRIWPVQEIALAGSCRVVLSRSMDQTTYLDFDRLISPFRKLSGPSFREYAASEADYVERLQPHQQRRTYMRQTFNQKVRDDSTGSRMSALVMGARHLQSEEPRDKIYALHGIFKLLHLEISPPDYTKDVRDVYTEAITAAFRHDRSFELLGGLTGMSRYPKLPSWVSDCSKSNAISKLAS
ncbi:hypothetical protein BU25DRAFT_88287 [Macroventuria anomochaeta]|uniref:Uncharacterized protein n=1 Tax=Macroventuria anomochaeta TaxID=301207 RepID=A0ACB6SFL6_9PLEO|nr:uncharacterized protein BU25DRAFT_88287 [Macroventuria anomochaeta]KAF2633065.1 hypothetical protein BU25DRAFT_88287 [Macroventuria anomochaeta]